MILFLKNGIIKLCNSRYYYYFTMKEILTVLIPTYNSFDAFKMVLDVYMNDKRVKVIVSDDSDNNKEKILIEEYCKKFNIFYVEGPRTSAVKNWNRLLNFIDTPFFCY